MNHFPPPPGQSKQRTERPRPKRLRDMPRFLFGTVKGFLFRLFYIFSLVWKAAPALLIAMVVLCLLDGVLPVFGAYISADLLNEIANLITQKGAGIIKEATFEVMRPLLFLFIMNLVYLFGKKVLSKLGSMTTSIAGELVVNHIKLMIIGKAKEVDLSSYDNPEFYEKLENANREAGMRPISILTATFNVISAVISAFSFIAVLVTLSPWAPIIVILSAVPGAIVNFYFRNKNFRYIRFHSKERRQMNYYSGLMVNKDRVKEIKILGLGETFISKYKTVFAKYYKGLKKIIVREGIVQIAVGLLTTLISSALFVYVAFTVINGDGLVGDYSLYSGALTSITTYVGTLLASTVTIYEGTLFIDNMITFMKEEPKIVPTVAEPLKVERGIPHKIEIKNVSFAYPGTERMVLKNLNLTIEANDSIVLVGLNGAGKTTLIKLLTRLYDPTEGEILLDGHSLKEYDPVSLYSAFGIIFQDFGHYAETVSENVRFGDIDREYDEAEIHLAAKRGGAESFINRLPDGYNTPLTRMFEENGIEPSGGQWQKLSVARAFYTDSEILIMDEPTASLDPIAEREVFDQYALLAKNKISVFVSHKLSSAVNATKIVVIDDGRIVEVGSHDELMRLGGSYCNLFTIQAQRYAGVTAPADAE